MTRRASLPILAFCAIALAIACDNAAGPSATGGATTTPAATTTPEAVASVNLGPQAGMAAVGTSDAAAFAATTLNVADGTAGTISWFTSAAGTTAASAPTGITATVSAVSGNAATVSVTAGSAAGRGSYYFTLTEGRAVSSVATLKVYGWESVGSAGFSAGSAAWLKVKLDSSGSPYAAYSDGGNGGKATVMKYEAATSAWSALGGAGFTAGAIGDLDFALDPSGVPYLFGAYSGWGHCWKYDDASNSWSLYGSFVGANPTSCSMSFDAEGTLVRSYQNDGGTPVALFHNGTDWTDAAGALTSGVSICVALAIDSKNAPYLAFTDSGNSERVTVMKADKTSSPGISYSWSAVGPGSGVYAGSADFVSLALGPSDVPYLAIRESSSSFKSTVLKYDGATTSWSTVGAAGFSPSDVYDLKLALSPSGVPYVAFSDGSNADKIRVMKFDAATSTWTTVGQAGFSAGYVENVSMAIDSSGVVYVAYSDGGNSDKATVMRFL